MSPEVNIDDEHLVKHAQAGDAEAFDQLVEKHYMTIYKIAYRWCGVKEDAEDIAQEVCIKLGRVIGSFEGQSSFTSWLYRITVNQTKDMLKSAYVRHSGAGEFDENIFPVHSTQESTIAANELYAVIRQLPEKQKDAVLLVFAEGMSHKEAADILGCAETTISWRIFNAKKKLKSLLDDKGAVE